MSLEISPETTFLLDMDNSLNYGAELHTLSNAAADPNGTEADATTGFTSTGLTAGTNTFASQAGVKNVGSYAIEASVGDTPSQACAFWVDLQAAPFSFVNGERGKTTFDIRSVGTGGLWTVNLGSTDRGADNEITTVANTETSFKSIEYTWTHSASHRWFNARELSVSNDGGVYFDNWSVKKAI